MGKEKIIKIGMIDDHDLLRKGICDFIRDDDNFEIVFEAENGKLALKKMEQIEVIPDIMVVDINMPVMNGFEASEEIRRKNKEVPIIALTAYALKGDIDKCMESGMNDYLAKPYKMQDLYDMIKKYME